MKRVLLLLLLVAATYNETDVIDIDEYNLTFTLLTDSRAVLESEYGSIILKEGDCTPFDIRLWCLDNITKDKVEFWPAEYEIVITHDRVCGAAECFAYGQECNASRYCSNSCVHDVCRPTDPWCGDGICDDDEVCSADCSVPVAETLNETENESIHETPEVNETIDVNDSSEENQTLEQNATAGITVTNPEDSEAITAAPPVESFTDEQRLTASPQRGETNIVGAGILVIGCLMMIFWIFHQKKVRKEKGKGDLYSYRK